MISPLSRIQQHLEFLYGKLEADRILPQVEALLARFRERYPQLSGDVPSPADRLTEKDVVLITYGDQFNAPDCPPLRCLESFLDEDLRTIISGVHLLPFYPYSSDDGFSIIDYRQVDSQLGDWEHIAAIGDKYRLMFDAVINHISQRSDWFQAFLRGEAPYSDYFISVDPGEDLTLVTRPRALPLLTSYETTSGPKHVWTTFSADQIDLNYANPQVLLEIVDLLLFYVAQGAEIIRLDAIAYLWKQVGTTSIHLRQTHHVIKLFRAVLDAVAPGVILITETNVPHEENISYFGEPLADATQYDEAQMVYQFPLAPLVLHSFHTEDASVLSRWVASLSTPSPATTFFNFIASHDGIGVMPARGLLSDEEIQALVERTLSHGGQVSHKTNPDGSKSVYELNITLYDLLNNPHKTQPDMDIARFLASQAIMLSLAGVPGVYVHSLFGSSNCHQCAQETGRARSINRYKFDLGQLRKELTDPRSQQSRVLDAYLGLLQKRCQHPAFHPNAAQQVLDLGDSLFALLRTSPDDREVVLCLVNVSQRPKDLSVDLSALGGSRAGPWRDLIEGQSYDSVEGDQLSLPVRGYQTLWLHHLKDS